MDEGSFLSAAKHVREKNPIAAETVAAETDAEISTDRQNKSLPIRTTPSTCNSETRITQSPKINNPIDLLLSSTSSPYNSPSLISPPSSAFVSALQSPCISPRATVTPLLKNETSGSLTPLLAHPSPPVSYCGSKSDDIPSSSYTPPPETYDFPDDPIDQKLKFVTCVPVPVTDPPPRISFSFQVPQMSFAKGSVSPYSNTKLRSCDVFIGFHGQNPNLVRFCKWLKSELEVQGIACFAADRAKYSDSQSHETADRVICSVTFGIVVVSSCSLCNHLSLEEIRFFAQKKNLIPLFFDMEPSEITALLSHNSDDKEHKETIEGLTKSSHDFKLAANEGNWKSCIAKAAGLLRTKLGCKSINEKEIEVFEELPFQRNRYFVGRDKELMEIESAFFASGDNIELKYIASVNGETGKNGSIGGNPALEAWVEPIVGRPSLSMQSYKKSKNAKNKNFCSVVCINGAPGIGKTELAQEFAYRYSQRYKMVLWVGGEARYFRQNIFNLSLNLGLDVSADAEKERGRIRGFEEQEFEAFNRVKRELFRDMPYLVIIDNLEAEKDWWEGKDLHDLIPRNTRGSHVIITTRLSKVMNFEPMQLLPLSLSDAMILMRGKRKKGYPSEELEFLKKFDEKLGRSTYGLWLIGSLLSEISISPSELFEAVNQAPFNDNASCPFLSIADEQFCRNNPFLMKVLSFATAILQQTNGSKSLLAWRMLLVGAWFAPSPIPVNLLATAAKNIPSNGTRLKNWTKCASIDFLCCSGCCASQTWKSEEDSAFLLVKLGLARRANRQPSCWIQFHPITQIFARRKEGLYAAKTTVQAVRKNGNILINSDHLWASAFLVFGFKSEPPLIQLKATDMVLFIKRTALPLSIRAFTMFSRCNSALELLKVCTNMLEEVEKSFVSQIQDWCHRSHCWKKRYQFNQQVDEYVWQDVTLLKATLLETRAKLLMRGGHFDSGEELCRTCISIRTMMLGHNHAQTLAAQETLAKLVRLRSKFDVHVFLSPIFS